MPLFGRKAPDRHPANGREQERADLLRSIRNRGQADVAGAATTVDTYLAGILAEARTPPEGDPWIWARDQMRFFIVVGWSGWFGILDGFPEEASSLKAEYRALVDDPGHFGPEHLVAWWWLLQPALFRPLVDNQLNEMRGALVDQAQLITREGGNFRGELKDWKALHRDWSA